MQFLIAYGVSRVLSSGRLKIMQLVQYLQWKNMSSLFYLLEYFYVFHIFNSSHLEMYIFLNNKSLCSYVWGVIFNGRLRTFFLISSSFLLVLLFWAIDVRYRRVFIDLINCDNMDVLIIFTRLTLCEPLMWDIAAFRTFWTFCVIIGVAKCINLNMIRWRFFLTDFSL